MVGAPVVAWEDFPRSSVNFDSPKDVAALYRSFKKRRERFIRVARALILHLHLLLTKLDNHGNHVVFELMTSKTSNGAESYKGWWKEYTMEDATNPYSVDFVCEFK